MQRRDFLSLSAITGATALLNSASRATAADTASADVSWKLPVPEKPAQLNLCLQWGAIPGGAINQKLDFLEANGFAAVELPTGKWLFDNHSAFKKALEGRKLTVATACGPSDFSHAAKAKRDAEVAKFLPQLEVLGDLKSVGLILCPARRTVALGFSELREDFINNTGKRLAEHAAKHGTSIVLEPLTRGETPFLNLVADGANIARAIGPGATVMGDFWHMSKEETSCLGAFISGGTLLSHVHIASLKDRKIPAMEPKYDKYVDGFRGLKIIGYRGAVSLEGGFPKGADKTKLILTMVKYLRDQWEQA
ncbi:MAG: sugar phosphate isomerase/epimerase [Puniceicoccales bacterium]|jgi:sugar phosphate isomerase/epimerase|nr:sugar phosphate isomerase/epimerase [Puniceicoccales bacterium]